MARSNGLWMVLGIMLSAVSGAYAAEGADKSQWSEGRYQIQTQLNGKCLDVPDAKFKAGTALQVWQCWAGNPAQVFELTPEHQIRAGGLCLNIFGGRGNNGDTVGLWQCVGAPNEKWDVVNGHIIGMNGRCLDVYGADRNNGARIIVWDCVGGASNQLWSLAKSESGAAANAGSQAAPPASTTAPDCPQCPSWVAQSFKGTYLPLAAQAEIWSAPKPFKGVDDQLTVQSRFMGQKGTTCRFEVQFNNVLGKAIDEKIVISRPGKAAVSQYDTILRAKLKPRTSVAYGTEIRECPLNWGETKDMEKCAACEPTVYFYAQ